MRVSSLLVVLLMLMGGLGTAQETATYVSHYRELFPGPQVYKDPHSGTTLYLETDGRHVAAISSDGKLLWNRDPFKDAPVRDARAPNQSFGLAFADQAYPPKMGTVSYPIDQGDAKHARFLRRCKLCLQNGKLFQQSSQGSRN